ncbi:MAG: YqgE/AlgH family protein [Ectothiorhodospiraceae bacterium]|nr:YqgE/AlgH family protein [Chromatiales bacterium]MCP5153819.1 YqgE/AlgH family protein [Ectothiorhodospiraceae bacterium]
MSALLGAIMAGLLLLTASVGARPVARAAEVAAAPPSTAPDSESAVPARGRFLVASARLRHASFARSVVLLLEHDASGALGVIVNRPTRIDLATLLPDVSELADRHDPVFAGGPVRPEQVLVLLRAAERPADAGAVLDDVYLTASLSTLRRLATGEAPSRVFRAYAGYAGWAPGQLEAELARGDWHLEPGDADKVFLDDPTSLWEELTRRHRGLWAHARRGVPGQLGRVSGERGTGVTSRPIARSHSAIRAVSATSRLSECSALEAMWNSIP